VSAGAHEFVSDETIRRRLREIDLEPWREEVQSLDGSGVQRVEPYIVRSVLSFMLLTWTACARPAPRSHSLDPERCASVDTSFNTVVIRGRWQDREVRILVDTGTTMGAISPSMARTLAARPGDTVFFGGTSGDVREAQVYDVEGLSVGKLALASFRAYEMTMPDDRYDLLIGLDELASYVVDFDLEEGWFCLRDRLPDGIRHDRMHPMVIASSEVKRDICIDATVAGAPVTSMIFDTGAGVSTINEDVLAQLPHRRLDTKVRSIDGSGVLKDRYYVEVPQLCVLGVCEPRHTFMPREDLSHLVRHPTQGIVGVPFFFRHRVILDFPGNRIGIDPPGARALDPEGCASVDHAFMNLVIRGRWQGREVRVLVDTGGTDGAIAPSAVGTLAARPGAKVRYAGSSGEMREASVYDVEELSIGKLSLAPFPAHEMAMLEMLDSYDLLIGLDQLASYVVDFDLEEGWFCLRDRLPEGIDGDRMSPMVFASTERAWEITVDATLAGTAVTSMGFNTGSAISTINEELLPQLPHRRLDTKVRSVKDRGVGKDPVEVMQVCVLGVCEPRHTLMTTRSERSSVGHPTQGIVGVPFFFRHRVILDFPGRRITIGP